jgi:hypothetical protein
VNPCGAVASAAGPHYQHKRDPQASATAPSVDASYGNPQNEVWLDVTTDANAGPPDQDLFDAMVTHCPDWLRHRQFVILGS